MKGTVSPTEKVLYTTRKTGYYLLVSFVKAILIGLVLWIPVTIALSGIVVILLDAETGTLVIAGIILTSPILIASLVFAYKLLVYANYVVTVTDKQIILETGIISKSLYTCPLDKVNNVNIHIPILGRLLGYGSVIIQTGAGFGDFAITEIPEPLNFKKVLLNIRNVILE